MYMYLYMYMKTVHLYYIFMQVLFVNFLIEQKSLKSQ